MYEMDEAIRKKQQKAGIEEAKEQGKYKGRKRKGTDTQLLEDAIRAFQEKALLRSDLFGELVFMDGTRCSVDTVYVRKRLRWGTHKVTVTREEEGIYSLAGSETLLFASRCSTLALRDEAVLEMQDSLSGILHLHGGTCRVEGVFEAISY